MTPTQHQKVASSLLSGLRLRLLTMLDSLANQIYGLMVRKCFVVVVVVVVIIIVVIIVVIVVVIVVV